MRISHLFARPLPSALFVVGAFAGGGELQKVQAQNVRQTLPPVLHFCAAGCNTGKGGTLVLDGDRYLQRGAGDAPGSVYAVEKFSAASVILNRTDPPPLAGRAVLTGQISEQGNSVVNGVIKWTWHPCCGLGSVPFKLAWGSALDTVPGDVSRARDVAPTQISRPVPADPPKAMHSPAPGATLDGQNGKLAPEAAPVVAVAPTSFEKMLILGRLGPQNGRFDPALQKQREAAYERQAAVYAELRAEYGAAHNGAIVGIQTALDAYLKAAGDPAASTRLENVMRTIKPNLMNALDRILNSGKCEAANAMNHLSRGFAKVTDAREALAEAGRRLVDKGSSATSVQAALKVAGPAFTPSQAEASQPASGR